MPSRRWRTTASESSAGKSSTLPVRQTGNCRKQAAPEAPLTATSRARKLLQHLGSPRSGRFPALPYPPLEQRGLFPVSVSLGVYRVGNGKQIELITFGIAAQFALLSQLFQGGAERFGADRAEFTQLLD